MVNKVQERIFAEAAAKLLAADWRLVDVSEPPDFEVWCGGERFGLEIRQIFVDQETHYGAPKKRQEAGRQRIVVLLAKRYYELGGPPVSAKFLGDLSHDKVDNLVKRMYRSAPRYPSSSIELEAVGVKIFLTPLPANFDAYSRWLLVNDRVGWLRDIRSIELQRAVDKKAVNLALYKQKYPNTALLLVADRTFNSGRMATSNNLAVQNPGFRAIYFMSYPDSVKHVG